ncbi:MAG: SLC13 family permease [Chloroflexota bacterium]|nr:SLC13 family permease [Chloroflexota bacterium]
MLTAILVFIISYAVIATERFPRYMVALLGGMTLIVLNIFDIQSALNYVSWETMGLLLGMFFLIAMLSEAGFFTWLAMWVAHQLRYRPAAIFIVFPLLAAFMAAFMDSITVMLFLSALTIRIAKIIKIDPIPLVAAEVCAANTGGAGTLVGDPPNVILGTMLGFNFNDFVIHTGPIAVVSAVVVVAVFYLMNRKMLKTAEAEINLDELAAIDRTGLITNTRLLKLGLAGFLTAIFLLITHTFLSSLLGITITTASAAMVPALIILIVGADDTKHTLSKIDMESLLFFIGLFIIVGALEKTKFIELVADTIFGVAQGNNVALLMMLHWGTGFSSAVVDNIPMALAMAYVMKDMAKLPGAPALAIMVWAVALGCDIGGNMTPVGASPNVVAYAFMERNYGKIGWARWIKMTVPPTIAAMLVSSAILIFKYLVNWY